MLPVPVWIDLMRQTSLFLLLVLVLTGCEGRTIKEDNPVLGPAPPRSALTADESYYREAGVLTGHPGHKYGEDDRVIMPASYSSGMRLDRDLTGNQVVASVNGQPLFYDEVMGAYAGRLEQLRGQAPEEEFRRVQRMLLRKNMEQPLQFRPDGQPVMNIVDQEIVLQAANNVLLPEQKEIIESQLDSAFERYVDNMKERMGLASVVEVDERLATEGTSLAQLRDETGRQQLALSFLQEKSKPTNKVERAELLKYYEDHIADYSFPEKVKWQQIVVRFNGDKEAAKLRMQKVWTSLKDGVPFDEVARKHSDGATAADGGEWDWIECDCLADRSVEDILFELPKGGISDLIVRDDRFELVRVVDRQDAGSTPFEDVQVKIEKMLLKELTESAIRDFLNNLRESAAVETIFDNENVEEQELKQVSFDK